MKKWLMTGLLATQMNVNAAEDIDYDFLEIGYGYLDLSNDGSTDGFYLDGAFELSDHFYMGGYFDNRRYRGIDLNRYHLIVGYHTEGSAQTEFYTDLRIGHLDFGNVDGSTLGLFAGTRTTITDRFELITEIGFTNIDDINHDDGNNLIIYEAEVKGLFKLTKKQGITAGLEYYDDDFGAKVGYRYSF
ncbi:hypothetical protein [Marinicella sp. W31]|uniref:hypothetical protein n=1 Tax=Marinicella sp. W31 TaxID=3023713 RepID=UPI00375823E8